MEGIVAQRYAASLFEVGVEQNCLDSFLEEMTALNEVFTQNEELVKLLHTPTVSKEEKLELVENIFGGKVSQYVLNFLKIMTEKGRMDQIFGVYNQFKLLYNEEKNIQEITAVTAIPLQGPLFDKLKEKLEQVTGKQVILTNQVDPSILGGVIIRMQDDQVDASVKTRLEDLKQHISAIIA
ncbi:MAG: F0F1 ATP synthase subunit delta [Oscillospiraceae bacterium]|uniref:F0F1 ATP synthase subunit delta n=1 Tax=Merdimmobilis hominis TaxID=2897707 RepID=UPI0009E9F6EB|nr:F0F1 ATP synthase subunit delta [Merdimmobilis hominis]PWL57215.1 MAG: F0F1 ATP synthase subunit delta [Oscillospiraceae bacterium]